MSAFKLDEGQWSLFERLVAEGFQAFGEAVADEAGAKSGSRRVAASGGAGTFVDGRRVAGNGDPPRSMRPGKGVVTLVGFGSPISHLIELGTAPHVIHVRNKSVLADTAIFGTTVHHPGTRARPFLTPTFMGLASRLGSFVRLR